MNRRADSSSAKRRGRPRRSLATASRKGVPALPARRLIDDNAGALLDRADAADEEVARAELRLERERLLHREGDQQPARRLRAVAEREQLLGVAVPLDRREPAAPRGAARAHARARERDR